MRFSYCLFLICLIVTGCSSPPEQTFLTRLEPLYSLSEPDELPRALRVPLTMSNGYLFVNGQVNGVPAGEMLFDTGSSLNIIDTGAVTRFGLKQTGSGKTVGIGGAKPFKIVEVDSLAIAGLDLGVDRAGALSMYPMMRGLGVNAAGLIGSISLMPHPFTIDYGKKELIVYQRDRFVPPKGADRVRLYFYGRLPAVKAKLANGREVLLIIDTGMDYPLALPMEVSTWPGIVATSESGASAARGVGGVIQTREAWLESVEVFGHRLDYLPVTFEPKIKELRAIDIPVGRVGGQVLQGFRLTFDARYQNLWCEFIGQDGE